MVGREYPVPNRTLINRQISAIYPPGSEIPSGTQLSASILTQQRVISILLIVQGTMAILMGLLFIGAAIFVPQVIAADMQRQRPPGGPSLEEMRMILLATYGVMGACGVLPGILQIYAGFQNLWLRGHTLGLVAICGGVVNLGTCYCFPTALALMIYGMIIYLNPTTKMAFELAKQGQDYEMIMQQTIRRY